ncbi:aPHP domain protein [Anopheles sinensis]|uniref:APHP domain protein n=1 Tax=Anopheles sinensis TaxID=74873 RepID=A0A084WC36_ANOSI|nr:aPHP domain protein [Anopheles sinensis]
MDECFGIRPCQYGFDRSTRNNKVAGWANSSSLVWLSVETKWKVVVPVASVVAFKNGSLDRKTSQRAKKTSQRAKEGEIGKTDEQKSTTNSETLRSTAGRHPRNPVARTYRGPDGVLHLVFNVAAVVVVVIVALCGLVQLSAQ